MTRQDPHIPGFPRRLLLSSFLPSFIGKQTFFSLSSLFLSLYWKNTWCGKKRAEEAFFKSYNQECRTSSVTAVGCRGCLPRPLTAPLWRYIQRRVSPLRESASSSSSVNFSGNSFPGQTRQEDGRSFSTRSLHTWQESRYVNSGACSSNKRFLILVINKAQSRFTLFSKNPHQSGSCKGRALHLWQGVRPAHWMSRLRCLLVTSVP